MVTVHPRWRAVWLALLLLTGGYAATASRAEQIPIAAPSSSTGAVGGLDRVDENALMAVVHTLASPRFEGRRTGTDGARAARAFIRDAFADIGLEPAGTSGYDQPFRFTHSIVQSLPAPRRVWRAEYSDAANLVGRVSGSRSDAPVIVVTAHYDHLGTERGQIYAGADDNASGIAALLAIARYIKTHPLTHPALFVALDAEELDLEGARAFMRAGTVPSSSIALDINLDMVSRNDRNEIYAAGTSHSPWLRSMLEDVQRRSGVHILFGHDVPPAQAGGLDDWTLQSDHGIFHQAGVPFLYFGVEDHPDYHRPTDTADKIDPVFFRNVVDMVVETVVTVDRTVDSRQWAVE